ncbi:MAG: GNAT family N-acetyltransferase [Gammaproteobacteria bacterium]|nr:GNAT family N-acetyltransferase [Gammaproteobacteria bacterium]
MNLAPATLSGRIVKLEPIGEAHRDELAEAARDPRIWENTPLGPSFEHYFDTLLALQAAGQQIPFAVRYVESGRLIGGTRFMDIVAEHRRLEIGGTWYAPDYWGGLANPDAKRLLLGHAFEQAGAYRVQLLTDVRNVHSQRAIKKLGAQPEGIIRSHMVLESGRRRDSMMFSILKEAWPSVKRRLEHRLHPP